MSKKKNSVFNFDLRNFDNYINYEKRKKELFKDYQRGYIQQIEDSLNATDARYKYTKITGKPETLGEYYANNEYLKNKGKGKVIEDIKNNLQDKDRILRIEENRKNHSGSRTINSDESLQKFPDDAIKTQFFVWIKGKADEIYKKLLQEVEEAKKEKGKLIAKDEEKIVAQQKAKSDKNAKNAEEAAAEKIYPTQVERTDYDSHPDEVERRERLIAITHLDNRGDKDRIDFGHSQPGSKKKRFWVDPHSEDKKLYAFYDKDEHLGELEDYKQGVTEYNDYFVINIQYQGILRKTDQIHSDYENGDIIITWYDEDEEYFNRQIEMKEAALKLSQGQRRNFWKVKWSSTQKKIFYTKEGYTDRKGDLIPYYNSEELPDYDITKGDYFGVPIEKSAPAPASPSIFGFTESVAAPSQQPQPPVAVPQELTNEWVQIISKSKGTPYYNNTRTKQSSWVKPPTIPDELYRIGWRTKYVKNKNKYDFDFKPQEVWNATKMPENMVRNVENLPVRKNATGWSSALSTRRGYYYYTNNNTGQITYQDNAVKGGKKTRKGKGKGKGKTMKKNIKVNKSIKKKQRKTKRKGKN